MHSFHFTAETSSDGVVERDFIVDGVPGVLWSPVSACERTALVLHGHGGGLHKRAPGLVARARQAVAAYGFHVAAIDAPGHGDRPRSAEDERWVAAIRQARAAGESLAPSVTAYNSLLAERAVPEWQATIDALQRLPEIGADAPIGYAGMTLASAIGLPLAAAEPRITAAVFGGVFVYDSLVEAAGRITVPIQFLLPWDDREIPRQAGLELFDAFASEEKVLLAFPGTHFQVPADRIDTRFFPRYLGWAGASPV
ncbi:alpha/beta hydrolase [Nocardia terpenica]|uniref:Alpha/beta hydrolase n=1 Tax=Nocardia terpenica TaxID=455432 RepID=A0A6G9ZBB0_9NOCA|nr:alpha/beta hydrolase [Nocardia terpenica]QIS22637.1 alpha/beta hydrolase [Nocardia terpenica]